jgi:hypothetical protein
MNRTLEEVLRHYINPSHTTWESLLPWAEFAINTAKHESLQTTPFMVNYGWQPSTPFDVGLKGILAAPPAIQLPQPAPPSTALTNREARTALTLAHPDADSTVALWRDRISEARRCLQAAQDRQKHFADKHRAPLQLTVGQSVLLSSKNIRIATTGTPKLLPRFLGPFKVLKNVGPVAVKLDLPPPTGKYTPYSMSELHQTFQPPCLP